jgi:hypothetical protein
MSGKNIVGVDDAYVDGRRGRTSLLPFVFFVSSGE